MLTPSSLHLHRPRLAQHLRAIGLLAALTFGRQATAQDFVIHVEPGAAMWLDEPQVRRLVPGFHLGIRPGLTLGRIASLQLSYGLLVARPREDFTEPMSAHEVKLGTRVRPLAPLSEPTDGLVQPRGLWFDANLGYVRSRAQDTFGFDIGAGYDFQVARWATVGGFLRYVHIVHPDRGGRLDAQALVIGVCLSAGRLPREARAPQPPTSE